MFDRLSPRRPAHPPRDPHPHAAFTLIEVLLVLVILVILGSMAVGVFSGTREKAEANAAKVNVDLMKSNIERYKFDCRKYPESLEDLVQQPSHLEKPERWGGPYLERLPLDPWDQEFQYKSPGERNPNSFDVWSRGPDGVDGNDDDIGNWE